ncbi:MAG: histidine biosynthesis protein [Geminicoccaceae bacterium]|nr:histidine biosynthesis protein [Geminicoccaceae bacterium]
MPSFTVVPVVDLVGGLVVHARAGERERYRPLAGSKLTGSAEPLAVVEALLTLHPFRVLYLADLDAIRGRGDHRPLLVQLATRFPDLVLWVDAGIASEERLRDLEALPGVRPVLGSESQADPRLLERTHALASERLVLSLDWRGEEPLDPAGLRERPELWPGDVIVMTLARVGTASGPDFARIDAVHRAAGSARRVWAAGGVRGLEDLERLRERGIAGALVATALHDGRLGRTELARLAEPAA